jgi:NAD(P)-dependent dehydrogenase (short-subunit alcohol dehydrogenase family)
MKNYHDFTGKTALITGSSRGLGRQIALALAERGANIVVTSRKLEGCEKVADEIRAMGRQALSVACHVGHWAELGELVDRAVDKFGRIDILVNNAGMSPISESSVQVSEALFDKIVAVNFKGPFRLAALVGSHMVSKGGGSIINVTSIGAVHAAPIYTAYAGSKAALNTITMALAREFGPLVRVNAIMPGSFRTDISKAWPADKEAKTPTALKRFAEPEEIITSILYLASDYSSFTTGSVIRVDGGRYAP